MSRKTDDVTMKSYTDEELNTLDPELAKVPLPNAYLVNADAACY